MHGHSAHLTTPSQPGRRLQWRSLALKSIAFGMALAATAPVQAKTFHCGAGDVPCLIAAITEANTNGQKKNRIQLDAGTYTLMAADNDTDGPNGFPSITSDLDITGARDEATGTIIERQARTSTFRLIHVAATGQLTLKRLTLRGGGYLPFLFPRLSGGGLFNRGGTVTITDSTLTNNVASFGGALYNDGGTVTLTHSILSGNKATPFSGGGGLFNDRGTVTLTRSTLANNLSVTRGGGILNSGTVTITDSAIVSNRGYEGPGGIDNAGILTITNSTLSGNSGRTVGAIWNLFGTVTILNSTISGNFSTFGSGGILNLAGTVALQNTILALNSTGARFTGPDCNAVTSLDNNLIGTTLNCTIILQQSDLTGDPGLASFTDDGRPGNGHYPLLPTSRAINAGNDAVCPERDQLGRERHHPCDIGAVEFPDLGQAEQDDDDDGQDD